MPGSRSQIVGNIGLFHVCRELSRYGWHAMPTTRNAKGADIIAIDPDSHRFIRVQTKARRMAEPPGGFAVGADLDAAAHSVDWWIVIVGCHTASPTSFILAPEEIVGCALQYDGKWWLQPRPRHHLTYGFLDERFREAWVRLGREPSA